MRDEVEADEVPWRPCWNSEIGSFDLMSQGLIERQDDIRANFQRSRDDMLILRIDLRIQAGLRIEQWNRSNMRGTIPELPLMTFEARGVELSAKIRRRLG
jgi:hypothetical protein